MDGGTSPLLLADFSFETIDRIPPSALDVRLADVRRSLGAELSLPVLRAFASADAAEPLQFPLLFIDSIQFGAMQVQRVASDATSTRYFSLGAASRRIPSPPDWYSAWDDSPLWRPAVLAPVDPRWNTLPGAAWLWTSSDWKPTLGEEVLFRQRWKLPEGKRVVRAVLRVGADHQVNECRINGQILPWRKQVLSGRVLQASVERILKPGENLLALSVSAPPGGDIAAAGVAWTLEITLADPEPEESQSSAAAAAPRCFPFSVRLADGSWIPAQRVRLDGGQVEITREGDGSRLQLARQTVRWIEQWPGKRLGGAAGDADPSAPGPGAPAAYASSAVPASYDETNETEGLWTTEGTFVRGRLERWFPDAERPTLLRSLEGGWTGDAPRAISSSETGAIRAVLVSPLPGEVRWNFPKSELARYVHLMLRDGSLFTGLIEKSSASRLILTLPAGARLTVRISDILYMEFPAMPALRARGRLERLFARGSSANYRIGFLGEVPCREGPGCPDSIIPAVERAAQALGAGTRWLQPNDLLSPEIFSPEQFPILINLDQFEAYYHTIRRSGDGHQALLEYIAHGGILIHIAPGTPFSFGRQALARQWSLVPLGGAINRALGMEIGVPGGPPVEGRIFEVPDNSPVPLEFARAAPGRWAANLPEKIAFPPTSDARFRPVSPVAQRKGAELIPLYRLRRGTSDYGLAAAIVRIPKTQAGARPSYTVYLSWPLALGRNALGESLLPSLLPDVLDAIARDMEMQER